jgi:hypothetical protein
MPRCAAQQIRVAYVGSGSKAALPLTRHVRFAPIAAELLHSIDPLLRADFVAKIVDQGVGS